MSLAAEDQLLICCSRVCLSDDDVARVAALLGSDLDWAYIVEASIAHAVAPLFYQGLRRVVATESLTNRVPMPVLTELGDLYRGSRRRNRRLYRAIGEITAALEDAGARVIGLKDIQLALEVYGDPALRPIGDVDLLIRRQDYDIVASTLRSLGFLPLPSEDIPFIRKYAWAHHFRRESDNLWLDIQWNIVQREWDIYGEGNFDLAIDRLWDGARVMEFHGRTLLVPCPEDMLFHLCLHLEGHAYAELVLFCDIVELLRHYHDTFNWDYFIDIVRRSRSEASVFYVLLIVQRLFQADLPPAVLQRIEPLYFQGYFFRLLYDNLTSLHLSLDDLRRVVATPDATLAEFERVVRRQAVSAMHVYRELDGIATSFRQAGGRLALIGGNPSSRIFPEPALPAFEEIFLLTLAQDLPLLVDTLEQRGYAVRGTPSDEHYWRRWDISSVDPVLDGRPLSLAMDIGTEHSPVGALQGMSGQGASKKELALRSIRARLGHDAFADGAESARVRVLALSVEEALLVASAWVSQQPQERLFSLCGVLETLRCLNSTIDWRRVAGVALAYGMNKVLCDALLLAREFLDDDHVPAAALEAAGCSACPSRILESARYDPEQWGRYAEFKDLFLFALSLSATRGWTTRAGYLLRSTIGPRHQQAVLPSLMLGLIKRLPSSLRRARPTTRDFAYWIEGAPSGEPEHDREPT